MRAMLPTFFAKKFCIWFFSATLFTFPFQAKYVVKEMEHLQEMKEKSRKVNEDPSEEYEAEAFESDDEKQYSNDETDTPHVDNEEERRNSSESIDELISIE